MSRADHVLLYEPRTEGHHLGWLRFITEDLLSAGFELSLAVDLRAPSAPRVQTQLGELAAKTTLISAYDSSGRRHGDGKAGSVMFCLRQSGAQRAFLCALDEVASTCWRRASLGVLPPPELHGRIGGIYHRPRFLAAPWWSPNRWLKHAGFRRLLTQGWLRPLIFVDPFLTQDCATMYPGAPIFFLPGPCPTDLTGEQSDARSRLSVPEDRVVFLFYGTGSRRKGLHLAVAAMVAMPAESRAFLLCVGQQNPQGPTARSLDALVRAGRARLINRYVSTEEEQLSFAAADVVLLPYRNHFGTSAVLFQAAAAGKMVIASDEQLLGRLTREHRLGLLFPSGNSDALRQCMLEATTLPLEVRASFRESLSEFARAFSREAYRSALLEAVRS